MELSEAEKLSHRGISTQPISFPVETSVWHPPCTRPCLRISRGCELCQGQPGRPRRSSHFKATKRPSPS